MNREQLLLRLAERLKAACAAADWQALADADREVGVSWLRLSARGAWTPAEQAALSALRQTHRESKLRCGVELERAREQLHSVAVNKDGWMAYAMGSDWEGERP